MPEIGLLSGSAEEKEFGYKPRSRVYAGPDWGWQTQESYEKIKRDEQTPLGMLKGGIRYISNTYQQASQAIYDAIPAPISGAIDAVVEPLSKALEEGYSHTAMGKADAGATQLGKNIGETLNSPEIGIAAGFALGMLVPGPGELNATKGTLKLTRPDVSGLRNADARTALGDFVTDPYVVQQRPSMRLESDPYYKATQKGFKQPTKETPMSKLPNVASPHHRIDVKGSIPYFEGSTPAAATQRRADLAVADLYPGNDPDNYVGLFDGVLSSKAGAKTGIFSDDHNEVHKFMDQLREQYGLKTTGGSKKSLEISKMISNAPEEMKTALLAQISLRDELDLNKVLDRRIQLAKEAFPNMSYDEFKDILINDPKRFANLYKTVEGNLASYIHPEYRP